MDQEEGYFWQYQEINNGRSRNYLQKTKNRGHQFHTSDELMVTTTPKPEHNYKKVEREDNRRTIVFKMRANVYFFHTLESSLEESDIGYKICGEKVESLRPYSEMMR